VFADRYKKMKQKLPKTVLEQIQSLHKYAKENCGEEERMGWGLVLQDLKLDTEERFAWALLFIKSTNGVADKVTCNHFRKAIERVVGQLSIDRLAANPLQIAAIIRQTSKWVKNSGLHFSYQSLSSKLKCC
jgi:hypothetical protein